MINDKEIVEWLTERDPLHKWKIGEDVYCHHCDGVFKAHDVFNDSMDDPNCPLCHHSSPIDFAKEPWWRPDLIEQSASKYRMKNTWTVQPIRAKAGKPTWLPTRKS
jgi:hypothetical protein